MKMYILVNKDIEMSSGKLAGQVGHAIANYIIHKLENSNLQDFDEFMKWYDDGETQTKIILKVKQSILEDLELQGFNIVRDLGKTEIEKGTPTSVVLGVGDKEEFVKKYKWFKRLRLL